MRSVKQELNISIINSIQKLFCTELNAVAKYEYIVTVYFFRYT